MQKGDTINLNKSITRKAKQKKTSHYAKRLDTSTTLRELFIATHNFR